MKLSDYKNFIKLFPTENSGYKIKKQNWLGTNQAKLIEEIFDNKTEIILTKEKIKKETDLKLFIVKTLMWGYPTKGRGNNINNLLKESELKKIIFLFTTYKKLKNVSFNQLIEDFKEYNIKGLGISTLSKFLHLLEIKVENYEAIILDDRIINILNENEFDELQNLKNISREYSLRKVKAKTNYLEYLKNLNTLAKKLDTKSENIEMFLFFFGKNLY